MGAGCRSDSNTICLTPFVTLEFLMGLFLKLAFDVFMAPLGLSWV